MKGLYKVGLYVIIKAGKTGKPEHLNHICVNVFMDEANGEEISPQAAIDKIVSGFDADGARIIHNDAEATAFLKTKTEAYGFAPTASFLGYCTGRYCDGQ